MTNKFKADPFIKDKDGKDALYLLIAKGHPRQIPVVKAIVELPEIKNHINNQADDGTTSLHIACARRDWQYIELLLGAGASVEVKNHAGLIPLDVLHLGDMQRLKIISKYCRRHVDGNKYDTFVRHLEDIATFNKEIFYTDPAGLVEKINSHESVTSTRANASV